MRVLRVCECVCECVWPPRAQVVPGLAPKTAEVMTPLASVQEREWEGDAAIHSTQTTQITHSLTHLLIHSQLNPLPWLDSNLGCPLPVYPSLPLHKGVRSTVWRLTNERTNANRCQPICNPRSVSHSHPLRSDPNPIPIVACGGDGDRFVGLASRCAVAKSEKGNGRLKMTTITQA